VAIITRRSKRHGIVYDVHVYQQGKKRWKRGFRTRGEARTYEAQCRLGRAPVSSRMTTGQLLEIWLRDVVEGKRAFNTERAYGTAIRRAVRAIGDIPARRIAVP
jgi:hypothetical protein